VSPHLTGRDAQVSAAVASQVNRADEQAHRICASMLPLRMRSSLLRVSTTAGGRIFALSPITGQWKLWPEA